MKKIVYTLIFLCGLTLIGCDQIKNRLVNKKENRMKSIQITDKNDTEELLNAESDLVQTKSDKPIKEKNSKANNFQLKLLQENPKINTPIDPYSVVGTKKGKPIRNTNSKRINTD